MALLALPLAPGKLTSLTLSRKEHSNADNDAAFLFCVKTVLQMADAANNISDSEGESSESDMDVDVDSEESPVGKPNPKRTVGTPTRTGILSPYHGRSKTKTESKFSNLERVVIRIFPGYGGSEHDEEADIWTCAQMMARKEPRVVLEKGFWGDWVKSWGRGRGV